VFDSIAEYKYYLHLKMMANAVKLSERVVDIERQKTFNFVVNGIKITSYRADFYVTYGDGTMKVIDVKNPYLLGKGKGTPAAQNFNYKKKLMKAIYGIDIIVA
jgi:hypothetical protein